MYSVQTLCHAQASWSVEHLLLLLLSREYVQAQSTTDAGRPEGPNNTPSYLSDLVTNSNSRSAGPANRGT